MEKHEERIRRIAHRIWEEVGEPTDQATLHWEMAEMEATEAGSSKQLTEPAVQREILPFLNAPPLA